MRDIESDKDDDETSQTPDPRDPVAENQEEEVNPKIKIRNNW